MRLTIADFRFFLLKILFKVLTKRKINNNQSKGRGFMLYKSIVIISSIFITFSLSFADLNDGLVAYYPFNGDAQDASDNGYHGVVNGATHVTDRFGKLNGALNFDGDDFIEITDNPDFDLDYVTISAWISPDIEYGERSVFTKDNFNRGYFLNVTSNKIWFSVGDGSWHHLTIERTLPRNQWSHLVGTFNGNVLKLYINGELAGEKLWSGIIVSGSRTLQIGRNGWYTHISELYFIGSIDDIRIYNRALSEPEIVALFEEDQKINFSDFTISKAMIEFNKLPDNDAFEINGEFTLAEESDGINPANENVEISLGSLEITIPTGSFSDDNGKYEFNGTINNVEIDMEIEQLSSATFSFTIESKGVNITSITNPVEITLLIGNDGGEKYIRLNGELKFENEE